MVQTLEREAVAAQGHTQRSVKPLYLATPSEES